MSFERNPARRLAVPQHSAIEAAAAFFVRCAAFFRRCSSGLSASFLRAIATVGLTATLVALDVRRDGRSSEVERRQRHEYRFRVQTERSLRPCRGSDVNACRVAVTIDGLPSPTRPNATKEATKNWRVHPISPSTQRGRLGDRARTRQGNA